jgi:hypothetical protein
LPLIHWALGTVAQAPAKALRKASCPWWREPQASGPPAVMKTPSGCMKLTSASRSWRFQASVKASKVARVTVADKGVPRKVVDGAENSQYSRSQRMRD